MGQPVSDGAVDVRRSTGIHALVALAATAIAGAYLWRGWTDDSLVSYAVGGVLVLVAVVHVFGWLDARTPLLVADGQGLRLRDGARWVGLPWGDVRDVELHPRAGLKDGRLEVTCTRDGANEQYVIPIGLTVSASHKDLVGALEELASGRAAIVAVRPEPPTPEPASAPLPEPEPTADPSPGPGPTADLDPEPAEPPRRKTRRGRTAAASVATSGRRAVRANVNRTGPATLGALALNGDSTQLPEIKELRGTEGRVGLVMEQAVPVEARVVEPERLPGSARIDDYAAVPASDPVIGPQVCRARERLRLSVDTLAERTRIRPHVIEAIEVDDFGPCGGDFYARGHLRTLARVLGLDTEDLLASYEERYSSGPINARKVFQAELATGPQSTIRLATGGPNWTALIAVVLVLAIVWAVAHLLTSRNEAPSADVGAVIGGVGFRAPDPERFAALGAPTSNELTLRAQGPARVSVRTSDGTLLWQGRMRQGDTQELTVPGVAKVTTKGAGTLLARVNDRKRLVPAGTTAHLGRR